MRWSRFAVAMLLGATVAGCYSRQDSIKRSLKTLNNNTAASVEEAQSVEELRKVLNKYVESKASILTQIKDIPKPELSKFARELSEDVSESDAALRAALEKKTEGLLDGTYKPVVKIETSMGDIEVELYEKLAPETVKNFLKYVKDGHYDGTVFHRVIKGFMIQGGGFEPGMKEKKGRESIRNESGNGLSNKRGTIAMARTTHPHSASDQFFINAVDNVPLDKISAMDKWGYTVFGKVKDGMDVVDKIRSVKTGRRGGYSDVPEQDVVIQSVRRIDMK